MEGDVERAERRPARRASSATCACRRRASWTPRRWMPTIASARVRIARCARRSRAPFERPRARHRRGRARPSLLHPTDFRPSWPHGTGLRISSVHVAAVVDDRPRLGSPKRTSAGAAAVGERDLDRVEVARQLRRREDRARLLAQLAPAVAGRDVRQREQPDLRVRRDPRGLRGRRVAGQARALALLLAEGRLVDQQVGARGPRSRASRTAPCRRRRRPCGPRAPARSPARDARRRPSRRAAGARSRARA